MLTYWRETAAVRDVPGTHLKHHLGFVDAVVDNSRVCGGVADAILARLLQRGPTKQPSANASATLQHATGSATLYGVRWACSDHCGSWRVEKGVRVEERRGRTETTATPLLMSEENPNAHCRVCTFPKTQQHPQLSVSASQTLAHLSVNVDCLFHPSTHSHRIQSQWVLPSRPQHPQAALRWSHQNSPRGLCEARGVRAVGMCMYCAANQLRCPVDARLVRLECPSPSAASTVQG